LPLSSLSVSIASVAFTASASLCILCRLCRLCRLYQPPSLLIALVVSNASASSTRLCRHHCQSL
jgi:hypothetical protein